MARGNGFEMPPLVDKVNIISGALFFLLFLGWILAMAGLGVIPTDNNIKATKLKLGFGYEKIPPSWLAMPWAITFFALVFNIYAVVANVLRKRILSLSALVILAVYTALMITAAARVDFATSYGRTCKSFYSSPLDSECKEGKFKSGFGLYMAGTFFIISYQIFLFLASAYRFQELGSETDGASSSSSQHQSSSTKKRGYQDIGEEPASYVAPAPVTPATAPPSSSEEDWETQPYQSS